MIKYCSGDHFRYYPALLHCLEYFNGLLRPLAFLTHADQGIVGDDIGHQNLLPHCLENLEGLLGLRALLAGGEQGIVGYEIWRQNLPLQCRTSRGLAQADCTFCRR